MHIAYLTSFIETVKQDSISKASKNLHMTQSALSQQLQALEKSLNTQLLIRSNKGVELTEEGEIILSYAEALVNIYENMLKELEKCKKSEIHEIKISSCNSVGEYLLPCSLHLYKKSQPDTRFSIRNEYTTQIIEHVLDCSADIGFIDSKIDISGIECMNISDIHLVFVFSSKRMIPKESVSLQDIAAFPLIIGSSRSSMRQFIDEMFKSNHIPIEKLNIEMELDSIESIKASVIANHGVSILPATSVKKELYTNVLKTLPIQEGSFASEICAIYQKSRASQPHIKEFISFIKHYGRNTFC
ncbi:DNA-binding transcriptional LysR family regulator [Anaerosolibacter carboniphilus]|uniref:DNA-binding transcriptional LysR family regulator n=1 Tax=Anaerosolibacter carboniphilus TaxID=1417629 RepID=A0A841L0V7_9FIRM|nr:LysR family transcriptional regulator [Anaerosolibacter carboniphilus]MBB6216009.1 DNA-binding transcriptional LysR family regulator [Anaerosolibacter carboniphilus]